MKSVQKACSSMLMIEARDRVCGMQQEQQQ